MNNLLSKRLLDCFEGKYKDVRCANSIQIEVMKCLGVYKKTKIMSRYCYQLFRKNLEQDD